MDSDVAYDGIYKHDDGSETPYIEFDGHRRFLGCLPCPPDRNGLKGWAASGQPIIDKADWKPINNRHLPIQILDQNGHNSCVGNGSAQAVMRARALNRSKLQVLSAAYIYSFINGGRDAGANISSALNVLMEHGTCLASQVPQGMIYRRTIQSQAPDADKTAARFKVSAAYHCDSVEAIMSALMLDFVIAFATSAGSREFLTLDSEGRLPIIRGATNHCVCADGVANFNGHWHLDMINSWGLRYGQNGRAYNPMENLMQGGQDCYAVQVVPDDSEETDPLPVAE